jgi:GABA(A) receptor-associated protein
LPLVQRKEYTVSPDTTVSQFLEEVRQELQLKPGKRLVLYANNERQAKSAQMDDIYDRYRDDDGFLYTKYGQ